MSQVSDGGGSAKAAASPESSGAAPGGRAVWVERSRDLRDDTGSSAVEFLLVGVVLTGLTLAILQLALAVYARNVVHDAAVEGAYHGALADVDPSEGATRTREIVSRALGDGFVGETSARVRAEDGGELVEVTIVATLPLIGFIGIPEGWEVTARAPRESLAG